jgi:BirA family biotin operon repressor/biotin-[acetyl-CoA-carboxylase] ligase
MSLGRELIHLPSIGSTMDAMDELARAGAAEGLVIVADEQTKGRGRSGRAWIAEPGSSLLCSMLLRPSISPDRLGPLPLMVGVAVAETIDAFVDGECQLKWPNDVLLSGGKVAGILLQSRLGANGIDYLNLGIGINVSSTGQALLDGAVSIAAAGGRADRDQVLQTLIQRLNPIYETYVRDNGRPDLSEWRRRATLIGKRISVQRDGVIVAGRFADVAPDGRLLLQLDSGEVLLLSHGDVSRGPRIER